MAEYYYIDLYFDPDEHPFCDLIIECVSSLLEAGCSLKKVVIPTAESLKATPGKGVSNSYGIEDIHALCRSHQKKMNEKNEPFVSFPPDWGRIVIEKDFEIDQEIRSDAEDEEAETNSDLGDIALSFRYTQSEAYGRKIKLTLSLWYDFVLSHGHADTHIRNLRSLISLLEHMSTFAAPYFGVMNTELHIDIDRSLGRLHEGGIPDGNDLAIVGPAYADKLNTKALDMVGLKYWKLNSGMYMIQFTKRWEGKSVL